MVRVIEDTFGEVINPLSGECEEVRRFTISNRQMSFQVITLGATVTSIKTPDSRCNCDDICMGFDDVEGYLDNSCEYFGVTIGPTCNRIENAAVCLNGRLRRLTKNHLKKHHLHGGILGYSFVVWEVDAVRTNGVTFSFTQPDGYEGYPGDVLVKAHFTLTDDNCIQISYEAETIVLTVLSMTNHIYFNLAGHASGKYGLYGHNVLIKSDAGIEVNDDQIPTGNIVPLADTIYDFSHMSNLGERLELLSDTPRGGIDLNYCLECRRGNPMVQALICHPCSGRWMEVSSDQPSMAFYTSNNLPDQNDDVPRIYGHENKSYAKHGAFCMQPQMYPDAPNHDHFPCIELEPGEKYIHTVHYRFGNNRIR